MCDDHLQLALVVERQHLHRHEPERHERGGADEQERHDGRGTAAAPRGVPMRRAHDAPVERGQPIFACIVACVADRRRSSRTAAHGVTTNATSEREQHRGRGADRDRAHVRPHQAADERHRQNRGDDRQRREDGRVADLVDRADGDRVERVARRRARRAWRTMFSTTTIASSTRMPIEKISANSVMRFSV